VAPVGEEDVFDMDGAFEIERVLDHAVGEDGIVQFKVRYVGFGRRMTFGMMRRFWWCSRRGWWMNTGRTRKPSWSFGTKTPDGSDEAGQGTSEGRKIFSAKRKVMSRMTFLGEWVFLGIFLERIFRIRRKLM
jgi:hypothetical protein